jgi:hypothetical protein
MRLDLLAFPSAKADPVADVAGGRTAQRLRCEEMFLESIQQTRINISRRDMRKSRFLNQLVCIGCPVMTLERPAIPNLEVAFLLTSTGGSYLFRF